MKLVCRVLVTGAIFSVAPLSPACAQAFPPQFRDIGIEQRPGAALPLDAGFRNESGASVRLGDYFGSKPVLLMPVYYTCQTLCSEALRGLVEGISPLSLRVGRDFDVVAFSFNPDETVSDARKKWNQCTMNYAGRRGAPGWHFLVGNASSIASVTRAIGFHYRYDPVRKMFIHASGMVIATPDGHIARYLFGVTYEPKDLHESIRMASHRKIGSAISELRLLCYPFEPANGRFGKLAMILLRLAAAAMVLVLAAGLIALWRYDLRRQRQQPVPGARA